MNQTTQNKIANPGSFLRTSRSFPEDLHEISIEIDKSYIEIAQAVNIRTIGIFPTNIPIVTGESWFFTGQKQETLRQMFSFSSTTSINHNLNLSRIFAFSRTFGEYTDGTNWYGLIPGTSVAIPGQISFYVTPTQIVFVVGAGAPALTKGNIVLEWISNL